MSIDHPGFRHEVLVVDNGSEDGTSEFVRNAFPEVGLIENGANVGFAAGNNIGARAAAGELLLILNPDARPNPGSLAALVKFAGRHPEAGAVACRVLNEDGSYQHSAKPYPTIMRMWAQALYLKGLGYDPDRYYGWSGLSERRVDWTAGCCLLIRREIFLALGGFDERFFYHYEDVDLCLRLAKEGHPLLFTPDASVTHIGRAPGSLPLELELEKCRNRYRYYQKHFGTNGLAQCYLAQLLRYSLRALGYSIKAIPPLRSSGSLEKARLNWALALRNAAWGMLSVAGYEAQSSPSLFAQDYQRQ